VSLLKQIIKEELKTISENESNDWDIIYTWAKLFSTDNGNFLSKNNITSGVWLKKAIEGGKIILQDIDNVTHESDGVKFSKLPLLKTLMGINEESATGSIGVGAGPIQTPYAFAPKGQKTNKATQTAMKQGFKKASGMPKNSKMFDYKELWKGKKSSMNEASSQLKFTRFHQDQISSLSPEKKTELAKELADATSDVNEQDFTTKTEYATAMRKAKIDVFKKYIDLGNIKESKSLEESITNIIKEELLNETSYNKFKNEVKYRTKNEMLHKSIREVKRKLEEVERLVEYTTRIKQELSENEEGVSYWKRSLKAINEISEVSNKISNKIKSIYQ
jgi:predicted aspartyl protease